MKVFFLTFSEYQDCYTINEFKKMKPSDLPKEPEILQMEAKLLVLED